jgi:glucose/mannose transport system substrate-binding protein
MMTPISRRGMLAGSAALLAVPARLRAEAPPPRVTVISQWSAGSDGAAITALGKVFEQAGGISASARPWSM